MIIINPSKINKLPAFNPLSILRKLYSKSKKIIKLMVLPIIKAKNKNRALKKDKMIFISK